MPIQDQATQLILDWQSNIRTYRSVY